ncbi:unnamed protein product [Rhizophagus irregularis]|nr:unnamed protein product [Rhizophagus irregularis]
MESFFSRYGTIKTRKSLFQKGYEKLRNVMYYKSRFSEYRQSSDANLGTMQKRIKNRPHVLQKDSSMICKSFSGIVASISIAHLSIRKIMHTNHFFPKVQHILT